MLCENNGTQVAKILVARHYALCATEIDLRLRTFRNLGIFRPIVQYVVVCRRHVVNEAL